MQRLCRGERAQPGHRSAATREAHSSRAPAHVAFSVLADPSRLAAIRSDCYEMLRTELTMRPAALLLAQLAADVRSGARMIQRRSRCRPGRCCGRCSTRASCSIRRTPCRPEPILHAAWPVCPGASRLRPRARIRAERAGVDVALVRSPGSADFRWHSRRCCRNSMTATPSSISASTELIQVNCLTKRIAMYGGGPHWDGAVAEPGA